MHEQEVVRSCRSSVEEHMARHTGGLTTDRFAQALDQLPDALSPRPRTAGTSRRQPRRAVPVR
ncbi:MAG: hypothetical protein ACRDKW_11140 [Actinomycetota bacterium]